MRRRRATLRRRVYVSMLGWLVVVAGRALWRTWTSTDRDVIRAIRNEAKTWMQQLEERNGAVDSNDQAQRQYKSIMTSTNLDASTLHIRIHVIANNRKKSLMRLLCSLEQASYEGDVVSLHLFLEANQSPEMMQYVSTYHWMHGPLQVHVRHTRGGLINAVVESWYPTSPTECVVLLEDDIEVSPLFYAWLKRVLRAFARNGEGDTKWAGISLYTPRIMEYHPHKKKHDFERLKNFGGIAGLPPFRHQQPCSWGALYFPHVWQEFRLYLSHRLRNGYPRGHFSIPGSRSNGWRSSWKKYMMELFWMQGYYLLYPNLPDQRSFSTNHLEAGEHISIASRKHDPRNFVVPLVQDKADLDAAMPENKSLGLSDLPILDMFGELGFQLADLDTMLEERQDGNGFAPRAYRKERIFRQCRDYQVDIVDVVSKRQKYSVVIQNVPTLLVAKMLRRLLSDTANLVLFDKIFVVLASCGLVCQRSSMVGHVGLYFIPAVHPSLHHPYLLDTRITTDAILYLNGLAAKLWAPSSDLFLAWVKSAPGIAIPNDASYPAGTNNRQVISEQTIRSEEEENATAEQSEAVVVSRKLVYLYQCGAAVQLAKTHLISNVLGGYIPTTLV